MTSPTNTITAVSVLTLVVLFWMLRRYRLPLMMTAYSIVVVALMQRYFVRGTTGDRRLLVAGVDEGQVLLTIVVEAKWR